MRVYNKNKIKILHITPHLGGGVGRVVLNYLSKTKNSELVNSVACLDYANEKAKKEAKKVKFPLFERMSKRKPKLLRMINDFDIVLIHLWNHPLLFDLLVKEKLPSCRLIIWSHIAGFYPPNVFTNKLFNYPDKFIFTTPASMETKEFRDLTKKQKNKFGVVWSTAGVEYVKSVKPKKHSSFNIGYIGTVDYAKLHPNFLRICDKINIPDIKFIVCGGANEKEINNEAKKLGIAKKFSFVGQVSNISEYLSIFDVFGYPLAFYHYGTCDQVLAESMAAGVVPVVFKNPMEKYMVKHGKTGFIANSEEDYVKYIKVLYKNKKLRSILSKNARKYAYKTFSVDKMVNEWKKIFKDILSTVKTSKKWNLIKNKINISGSDLFLESLGSYGITFKSYRDSKSKKDKDRTEGLLKKLNKLAIWKSSTKGTVHHYKRFFQRDRYLSIWSKIIKTN